MKKRNLALLIIAIGIISPFIIVKASNLKNDKNINITKEEVVDGNFYSVASEIIIDGKISGDLIAVAEKIVVNGELGGDLIAVSSEIEINGTIGGNFRAVASNIILNGKVLRNASLVAEKINFEKNSSLSWDLISLSKEILLNGNIKGNVDVFSKTAEINSVNEKDVSVTLSEETSFFKKNKKDFNFKEFFFPRLLALLSAILTASALFFGFKKHSLGIISKIENDYLQSFLYGLAIIILSPITLLFLAISIIGIPLSLSLAAIYAALLYLAKILTAIMLGQIFFKKIIKKRISNFWILSSGVLICWLIFSIPYVGVLAALSAASLGLGGIFKYVKS